MKDIKRDDAPGAVESPLVPPAGEDAAPAPDVMKSIEEALGHTGFAVDLDRGGGS